MVRKLGGGAVGSSQGHLLVKLVVLADSVEGHLPRDRVNWQNYIPTLKRKLGRETSRDIRAYTLKFGNLVKIKFLKRVGHRRFSKNNSETVSAYNANAVIYSFEVNHSASVFKINRVEWRAMPANEMNAITRCQGIKCTANTKQAFTRVGSSSLPTKPCSYMLTISSVHVCLMSQYDDFCRSVLWEKSDLKSTGYDSLTERKVDIFYFKNLVVNQWAKWWICLLALAQNRYGSTSTRT